MANQMTAAEIAALLRQTAAKQDEVAAAADGLVGRQTELIALEWRIAALHGVPCLGTVPASTATAATSSQGSVEANQKVASSLRRAAVSARGLANRISPLAAPRVVSRPAATPLRRESTPVTPTPRPEVRCTRVERDRCADVISAAFADGCLDVEEVNDRLSKCLMAKFPSELAKLLADLPGTS